VKQDAAIEEDCKKIVQETTAKLGGLDIIIVNAVCAAPLFLRTY
jgi:NAD(P)-dependent dehydrogenase (short-subunit alcohol dehydrogenase family)